MIQTKMLTLFFLFCALQLALTLPASADVCVHVRTNEKAYIKLKCGFDLLTDGTEEEVLSGGKVCRNNKIWFISTPCIFLASNQKKDKKCVSSIFEEEGFLFYDNKEELQCTSD